MTAAHPDLGFTLQGQEGAARAGRFETPHGPVETPAFMPVGTRATVKGITHRQLEALDPQVLLANTYHLHLRPGEAHLARHGGLHGFTGWERPWLTDSGGYQVFSLAKRLTVRESGVRFLNHIDGKAVDLSPERAVEIQEALGADMVMAFDECVGLPAPREAVEAAVDRTTRWAERCVAARTRDDQALFGIVQGGTDEALRQRSLDGLLPLDLPGYAIGGLAVGESPDALRAMVSFCAPRLPADRPRYLMGVGQPLDLLDGIALGIDVFDCVLPTRNGRRGYLYTHDGPVRVHARIHAEEDTPLDADCGCEVCRVHSRAYLRHLFHTGEHVATTLGSLHNLHFLVGLVRRARTEILAGRFDAWRAAFRERYEAGTAAWQAQQATDPEGARRSQHAQAEDDADPTPA